MSSTAQSAAPDPIRQRLRVVPTLPSVDMAAAQNAATDLLAALGVGLDSEAMAETPRRMAQAYAAMLSVPAFELTTFENVGHRDELLLVEDIPVRSLCECHMLPFVGVAHVGYLPGERILGPSKFAWVVAYFGRRPQTQERLTEQVAEYLQEQLSPRGIGVVIEAEHSCQALRGMGAVGARTRTSTLLGALRWAWSSRAEFLSLTAGRRNHHE
jgi:GTP cyclohydrolase IA